MLNVCVCVLHCLFLPRCLCSWIPFPSPCWLFCGGRIEVPLGRPLSWRAPPPAESEETAPSGSGCNYKHNSHHFMAIKSLSNKPNVYSLQVVFSLVVSEDVLEEMPVNGGEEGVQLILFQEGGSITPVKVCTTSSCLKEGALKQGCNKQDVCMTENTVVCRCNGCVCVTFSMFSCEACSSFIISLREMCGRDTFQWSMNGIWLQASGWLSSGA